MLSGLCRDCQEESDELSSLVMSPVIFQHESHPRGGVKGSRTLERLNTSFCRIGALQNQFFQEG
jgi:hypothetical protein